MKIREIETDDLKNFNQFYEELAKESDYLPFSPEEVEEKLKKLEEKGKLDTKHKQLFVAVDDDDDDKIIGFLGIARGHFSKLTHRARFMVGVLKEYQRQGIASELIDYAEDWAEDNDIKRLELTVVEGNDPAIALFEKKDYVKECTHKSAVLDGDDDYVDEVMMAKIL